MPPRRRIAAVGHPDTPTGRSAPVAASPPTRPQAATHLTRLPRIATRLHQDALVVTLPLASRPLSSLPVQHHPPPEHHLHLHDGGLRAYPRPPARKPDQVRCETTLVTLFWGCCGASPRVPAGRRWGVQHSCCVMRARLRARADLVACFARARASSGMLRIEGVASHLRVLHL